MTNYYAYIEPEQKEKEVLIKSILDNNPIKIMNDYMEFIYNNIVHLGKEYSPKVFLWDSNYVLNPTTLVFPRYNPTKKSIEEFLTSSKVIIFDDNSNILNYKEFLNMAFSSRGLFIYDYYIKYYLGTDIQEKILKRISNELPVELKKNFSTGMGEFINDGLHFSTQTDFR